MAEDIEVQEQNAAEQAETKEEDIEPELEEKLPFPTATIVRLMKRHLDGEKMIKKEVKIAMNKWLGDLCEHVTREMNKFPYVMIHLHEFNKAKEMYDNIATFQQEKERLLAHLDAMKKDIERLEKDLGRLQMEEIK